MPSSGFSHDYKPMGEDVSREDEGFVGRTVGCAEMRVVAYLWAWG